MIGYITVTFELNIEGPDGGLTSQELVDQLEGGLPKEWWNNIAESEWEVRRILPNGYITCERCDTIVDPFDQHHDFDAVLCHPHTIEAQDEAKASTHYQDSDK